MQQIKVIILTFILISLNACALTGGTKTQYGGNVKLPEYGNYSTPSKITVIPIPSQIQPELMPEDLIKNFYVPYPELFTATLKVLKGLNFNVETFNSSNGTIEFKTIQGENFYLKLAQDQEFNSRSTIKLFTSDGSLRIDKNFVKAIFDTIENQFSNKQ